MQKNHPRSDQKFCDKENYYHFASFKLSKLDKAILRKEPLTLWYTRQALTYPVTSSAKSWWAFPARITIPRWSMTFCQSGCLINLERTGWTIQMFFYFDMHKKKKKSDNFRISFHPLNEMCVSYTSCFSQSCDAKKKIFLPSYPPTWWRKELLSLN